MSTLKNLPVLNISNFEDYNCCMEFEANFYVRVFNEHIRDNKFLDVSHSHDFYLVLLITEGSGIHKIDFHEYPVEPGSMFVLSPGQMHVWDLSDNINGHILFFKKEYFLLDFNNDRLDRLPFFKSTFSKPYVKLKDADTEKITDLYKQINSEYGKRQIQYHDMIRLYLNIMFIELARLYKAEEQIQFEYKYEVIQLNRFEKLIDQNFKNHLPITEYADNMSLSMKQLNYICKKTINKTPSELIQERIMLESKRLLVHSELSISAIAEVLNFTDSSYFIRLFKKVCGTTPDKFRIEYISEGRKKSFPFKHNH